MTEEERWARGPLDDQDATVLRLLRDIHLTNDPAPAGLAERCKFAITVAALQAEVAELTRLSSSVAGVRGDYEVADTVTFAGEHLSAMITIEVAGDGGRRVSGWTSIEPVQVELRAPWGHESTVTDADGRFEFTVPGPGLVHLVLRSTDLPHAKPLITPPIEI